jgi:hypothetical protein
MVLTDTPSRVATSGRSRSPAAVSRRRQSLESHKVHRPIHDRIAGVEDEIDALSSQVRALMCVPCSAFRAPMTVNLLAIKSHYHTVLLTVPWAQRL